jgi:hypothetical protein
LWTSIIGAAIVSLIATASIVVIRKHHHKRITAAGGEASHSEEDALSKARAYVSVNKQHGVQDNVIKNQLLSVGWSESIVNELLGK